MAKTLLLADDSVTIQKVVGISFANEDVELLTVDNGDDAILRAREAHPDVILADVVMPGKNGYEVCEAVKSDPALAYIPVLLLTGTFEAFDEERAASAGSDGHITKPFEAQALVDKVNELMAQSAAAAAAAPAPAPAAEPAAPIATAAPQAEAPSLEPPAAATDSDDDGFDFFDDDLETDSGPPSGNAATAFELDAGESAFDFAPVLDDPTGSMAPPSESPTVVTPPPVSGPLPSGMPDATMALGVPTSGADPAWNDDDLDAAFGDSSPDLASQDDDPGGRTTVFEMDQAAPDVPVPATEPPVQEPADDFAFSSDSGSDDLLGDFDAPDTPREAVSNPELGRDFAVSSSDLGDPLGTAPGTDLVAEPTGAETPIEPHEPDFPVTPGPTFDETPSFASDAEEPTVSPDETSFSRDAGPIFDATPEPEEPAFPASPELTEVPIEGPAEPPFDAPLETTEDVFVPLAETAAEDFAPPPPERPSADAGPDLTPVMRERVHEAMEKIAWEAFADLPDQIVRQALAKIEAIAWEVIPQMAEAMIQEEIRRMKGESE